MLVSKILLIILNISLLALMLTTKARSVEQPRPGIKVTASGIVEDTDKGVRRTISFGTSKF